MNTNQQAEDPADVIARRKAEEVAKWRKLRLVKAGYDVEAAGILAAAPNVDIHRAEYLLEKGCPTTTALLILL